MGVFSDFFSDLDWYSIVDSMKSSDYYTYVFPFLLLYALLYTALSYVSVFQNKTTKKPIKSVITILAFIISFIGVSFEVSSGYRLGDYLQLLFPNISAITIGFLALYIIAAMLGKDFITTFFSPSGSAIAKYILAGVGLASILFFTGIAMGFWDYQALDVGTQWNFILFVGIMVMGVVFVIIGLSPGNGSFLFLGLLISIVCGVYWSQGAEGNFLAYFVDPFVFIAFLIFLIYRWSMSSDEKIEEIELQMKNQSKFLEDHKKVYKGEPKPYTDPLYDQTKASYAANQKLLEKLKK
jgi:hypothetical protein